MKINPLHITATVQVKNGVFHRNRKPFIGDHSPDDTADWFKKTYKTLGMQYPKFFKMDALCKLATLAAEVLLSAENQIIDPAKTGVLLYNTHSSIDADVEHQNLIADDANFFPSPAVFVYTLPNIMLGEICIRHKITGENACFVVPEFHAEMAVQQCEIMMNAGMEQVILGYADAFGGELKVWMALVEKGDKAPNISQLSAEFLSELDNIPTWKH